MSIILHLPRDVERRLKEAAARTGQSLETFLTRLAEHAAREGAGTWILSCEDWESLWRAWAEGHQAMSPWADDSRESIYAGRPE